MKANNTSFLFFFFFAIIFSTLNAQKTIADSSSYYIELIKNPKHSDQLIASYIYFQNEKDKSIETDNIPNTISSLYQMADAQNKLGDLYGSETTAIEALELLDSVTPNNWTEEMKVTLLNHLGITSRNLYRYERALKYYEEVLKIVKLPINKAKVYGNKGKAYAEWGKPELAIIEYEKALKIALTTNEEITIARLLDNIGEIKSKLYLSGAIKNLEESLLIRKKNEYDQGIISSYLSLSNHYFRIGDFELASFNMKEALEIADKSKNVKYIEATLSNMIDQGDYSRVSEYKNIIDSLTIVDIKNDTKYSEAKYNYTKQEKIANEAKLKLKDSELMRTKQRSKITVSIVIAILIVLLSLFMFFALKSKHTKEKQKKVLETESRISKKIHDELANDVYSTMVQLENESATIPEIIKELEDIYQNARDISQEKSVYKTNDAFVSDLKRMLGSFKNDQTNVIVKGLSAAMWIDISEVKKVTALRVLKELLVNMKKHSKASIVSIVFNRDQNNLSMTYIDDGIGVYKKELINGTGLINAENRIKAVRGRFIFEEINRKGLKIDITIPL